MPGVPLAPILTPYYGGGQVKDPADVIAKKVAPSTLDVQHRVGTLYVNTALNNVYCLTGKPAGVATWTALAGGTLVVSTLTGDSGTATPAAGNIKIAGTANQIVTSGSGSTITLALTGPYTPATYTAHGVLIGEGTGSIVATSAGTSGQPLLSGGASADPNWGTLSAAFGGTGATTLTLHGVLLGNGASAIAALAEGATGTVLTGVTGANPAFSATPTVTSITFGAGSALAAYVNPTAWTPVLQFGGASTGITYATQTGTYVQIGKLVLFSGAVVLTSKGSATGVAQIAGLPIAAQGTNPNYFMSPEYINITLAAGDIPHAVILQGGTAILLYEASLGASVTQIADTFFANNSSVGFTGFYFTA